MNENKDITLWDAINAIQEWTYVANTKQTRNGLRPMVKNLYAGHLEALSNKTIIRIVFSPDRSYDLEVYDRNGKLIKESKHYPARLPNQTGWGEDCIIVDEKI